MQALNARERLAPSHVGQLALRGMRNTPLPAELGHQRLLSELLDAVVHKAQPLAEAEKISVTALAAEPFVLFDPQGGTALYSDILALLHRYHIKPYITQEVGEAMTILGLVATGLGVSILPASFRRARLADLVWLPLTEEDAISELWLVWSAGREINAQMENMMALLRENRA